MKEVGGDTHSGYLLRFGSDPSMIGRPITLDGESYTIVGVMPPGFQFPSANGLPTYWGLPSKTDIWTPIALTPEQMKNRGDHPYAVIARLKPDVTLQKAQAE